MQNLALSVPTPPPPKKKLLFERTTNFTSRKITIFHRQLGILNNFLFLKGFESMSFQGQRISEA